MSRAIGPAPVKSRPCLLIAESYDLIGVMLHTALERAGYQVVLASYGASALELALLQRVDLVLIATGLPDMNGLHLHERLCANRAGGPLPVVFMTGSSDDFDFRLTSERPLTRLLPKPLDLTALLRMLLELRHELGLAVPG